MNQGNILGGLIPQVRFTTVMILLINTALFIANELSPQVAVRDGTMGLVNYLGTSVPWPFIDHEYWRLVTAGFLHGNLIHILMNSWALFNLGAEVEQVYGTSRLIVFYFVSTVTGFLLSSMMGHQAVGSSAGIFGLIGAMLAFGVTDKSAIGANVKAMYSQWLIFGLVMSFMPHVDYFAHIGGVAGGFAAGYLASTPRARLMWKEPMIRGLAAASLALTAGAFTMMFWYMSRG
jgi:rhomboid protease GluP